MRAKQIIESGILELYIVGVLSKEESQIVEGYINQYPILRQSIEEIELELEQNALQGAIEPPLTIKPLLLTQIDYMERIQAGEPISYPPALHAGSKITDFKPWLEREDLNDPGDFDSMHGRIIGSSEGRTTLIIWLRHGAPPEIHTNEQEKFLILEGSCNIIIGEKLHELVAGDFIEIPLHVSHRVEVTSAIPCKIILERTKV